MFRMPGGRCGVLVWGSARLRVYGRTSPWLLLTTRLPRRGCRESEQDTLVRAGGNSGGTVSRVPVTVKEEYLLLDAATGLPAPQADQVRGAAGLEPIAEEAEIRAELTQAQIEVATPECVDLDEVGGHLLRLRHALGRAAESRGCRLAASATPPLKEGIRRR